MGKRIAIGGIGLVLLGVLGFLGPPHLQTRGISPALPDLAELQALRAVPQGPTAIGFLTVAAQTTPLGETAHTIVLVRWADGRRFMIDAGMDREGAAEFEELIGMMYGGAEGVFHGDVAQQLGPVVEDVMGVGFTHLHIDHTQGLGVFCDARGQGASVYQTAWQASEHNVNTREGAQIIQDSCLASRVLDGPGLNTIDAFPGLGVVALGGHTPGSTLFAVGMKDRLWLFSGDTTNSKASIREDTGKGFLYSFVLVPENTSRTGELRRWLHQLDGRQDTSVIVSHDANDAAANGLPAFDADAR